MTGDELIEQFENCSLPLEWFRHKNHVQVAFLYLGKYPILEALARFSASLMRFAAAKGKAGLYNETITWAFLFIIRERMARAGGQQSWAEFSAQNEDLLSWGNSVLKKYYREQTLASDLAKRIFILPDL